MYSTTCLELLEISKIEDDLNSHARSNRDMYRQLKTETNFLSDKAYARERLWYVEHNTRTPPHCKMCSKPTKWNNLDRSFQPYCSTKCAHNDPELRERIESTNMERYGNKCSAVNEEVKSKFIATNMERYGVAYPVQTEEIQAKRRATNLERHGNIHGITQHSALKRKNTMLKRYGVTHWMKVPMNAEQIRKKVIQHYIDTPKTYHSVSHIDELHDVEFLNHQHNVLQIPLYQIATDVGVSHSCISKRFRKFNIPIRHNPHKSYCEQQVIDYVKSVCKEEIISGDYSILSTHEIDIYIPSLHIAIEFDGIRYHSENYAGKSRNYHLEKTRSCEQQGIQLIHIFESEWIGKRDIVCSRLSHILKVTSEKIYARKCVIKNVTYDIASRFFEMTHLQGSTRGSVNLGLYYNDVLVACMSFCKSRFSKSHEYELLRYSTILNSCVVGGAAKLFEAFKHTYNPLSVITYSDRRWSQGNLYVHLGFKFDHNSQPNYFYFHQSHARTLLSRQHFQKHKLESKLAIFDPLLSEWENMKANGYDRIWDCGNGVWSWYAT